MIPVKLALAFFSLMFLLLSPPVAAQDSPLTGPLVAVDTATQDRILLYDLHDLSRRELHFGTGWHRVWGFSADGCRVAFTLSQGTQASRLYSARIDGSDMRELVVYDELPPEQWQVWNPQWSPDGSRIAFTMVRDRRQSDGTQGREYHIAWIPAEGGEPTFYSNSGDEHEPQWSPDGEWLAYIAYEKRVPGAEISATAIPTEAANPGPAIPESMLLREADLWIVRADGSEKHRMTYFETGSVRAPHWSPDGDLIGFVYSPRPSSEQFWMIGSQAGALPTQLSQTGTLILALTWLPDSTAMLAAARHLKGIDNSLLWQIPLVGLADDSAATFAVDAEHVYTDYPSFAPSGKWLAFRNAYALTVFDTENAAWTYLDADMAGNTPPVWSPVGFVGEAGC